jgi:hypothetical protein
MNAPPTRPAGLRSRRERLAEASRTVLQVLAILALAAICLTILHKGYSDVSAIARGSGRDEFWPALLRYVFRNLAGG